ncbi:hypothetical protein FGAF1267_43160 [Escherichia coli]|nr:hypothetical protein FGAF637_42610 [Escherichia coli]CAK0728724.1 hypothetical protein FGAF1267_43160 [Escherichia coli]
MGNLPIFCGNTISSNIAEAKSEYLFRPEYLYIFS